MNRRVLLFSLFLTSGAYAVTCEEPGRYSIRAQYTYEDYSFFNPGHEFDLIYRDRSYQNWDLGATASYVHRFALDDSEATIQAAHKLGWKNSWLGASLGGASRAALLPRVQGSVFGGMGFGGGFSTEDSIYMRHYDDANVYGFSPSLIYEGLGFMAVAGYTLSTTYFTSGVRSGYLSSYSGKLQLTRFCVFQPWVAYARTREPFEEGFSGAGQDFTSNHYQAGADIWLAAGWRAYLNYDYEDRISLDENVKYYGVGISYSWGAMP